jgi:hypothetical protein
MTPGGVDGLPVPPCRSFRRRAARRLTGSSTATYHRARPGLLKPSPTTCRRRTHQAASNTRQRDRRLPTVEVRSALLEWRPGGGASWAWTTASCRRRSARTSRAPSSPPPSPTLAPSASSASPTGYPPPPLRALHLALLSVLSRQTNFLLS